jgi:hypothetical protein
MKLMSRLAVLPAGLLAALLLLSVSSPATAGEGKGKGKGEAKFEAQLIWVTNEATKSKDAKLKPVDPEVQKKLDELPLKWKSYYMVKRESFSVAKGGTNSVVMSDKCTVELKRLDEPKVEVTLHGKNGNVCSKRTQPFPKAEILIFSGKAAGDTAWLVTLKRIE